MITLMINIILGWIGAGIVNYLADVLPEYRKFVHPRCPECQHERSWKHYLLLTACEKCKTGSGVRSLLVLIVGPVLAVLLYIFPIENLGNYGSLIWLVFFGLVVIIDLEHRLILHPVSLVGAVLGLIFGILEHGLVNTLLGGAAGFGIMLGLYFLGELFIRIMSKSRGEEITEIALGFGDVNLAGVIGLLLGWPGIIGGIFLAIFLGGIVSGLFLLVQLIRKKYQAFQALPYGPFMVLSVVVLFYISQTIG
jgi:leader peptidase (prepilin peptidase)/N-methyltransferase